MSKTTDKFAPEVSGRAVRMVVDHERDYPSRWATVVSIAEKIGCVPQTSNSVRATWASMSSSPPEN
jgi:transposase